MIMPIEQSFSSKLVYMALIVLIVVYVVFVKKSCSVVESAC
jgi:hypothetical protein